MHGKTSGASFYGPLPAPNTPLAEIFEPLRAAAANGDGAAACRLVMETLRCRNYANDLDGLENIKRVPSELLAKGEVRAMVASLLAQLKSRVTVDGAVCRDAPPDDGRGWRMLLDAARAGHVPSMARFASGSVLRDSKGRGEWDLEAFAEYRTHALEFLVRAAYEGDVEAMERLGTESLSTGLGTRAIPYDPVRGLAILKALSARAAPSYRAQLESTMESAIARARVSPADVAEADTAAMTVLPADVLSNLTEVGRPGHSPVDDFGCRETGLATGKP